MEVVQTRFERFKAFIRENGKVSEDNVIIQQFMQTTLEFFLVTVKSKLASGVDKKACLEEIFTVTGLKMEDYKAEQIDLIVKYMEYFSEISNAI
jgi:hypothetical protein